MSKKINIMGILFGKKKAVQKPERVLPIEPPKIEPPDFNEVFLRNCVLNLHDIFLRVEIAPYGWANTDGEFIRVPSLIEPKKQDHKKCRLPKETRFVNIRYEANELQYTFYLAIGGADTYINEKDYTSYLQCMWEVMHRKPFTGDGFCAWNYFNFDKYVDWANLMAALTKKELPFYRENKIEQSLKSDSIIIPTDFRRL